MLRNVYRVLDAKANDSMGDSYFLKFMKSLLALFSSDRGMQEERWAFIIRLLSKNDFWKRIFIVLCFVIYRQLCVLLSAEDIYRTFAEILIEEKDCKFASVMVETLSTLLLTCSELFPLRSKLKDLSTKVSFLFLFQNSGQRCEKTVIRKVVIFLRCFTNAGVITQWRLLPFVS